MEDYQLVDSRELPFQIEPGVVYEHAATIGTTALALYTVLVCLASRNVRQPARSYLARLMGCNPKTVDPALEALEKAGLIQVQRDLFQNNARIPHIITLVPLIQKLPNLVQKLHTFTTTTIDESETAIDPVIDAWIKATGGYINAGHAGLLDEYRETYTDEWVLDAIKEMVRVLSAMELRTVSPGYILSILKRWARDGKPEADDKAAPPEEWRKEYS